jgi:hypothetical protein
MTMVLYLKTGMARFCMGCVPIPWLSSIRRYLSTASNEGPFQLIPADHHAINAQRFLVYHNFQSVGYVFSCGGLGGGGRGRGFQETGYARVPNPAFMPMARDGCTSYAITIAGICLNLAFGN